MQECFTFKDGTIQLIACENICFSSLFIAGDVSCVGTSASDRIPDRFYVISMEFLESKNVLILSFSWECEQPKL